MKSSKSVVVLVIGILIALILTLSSTQEVKTSLGLGEMKMPKLSAPALKIKFLI